MTRVARALILVAAVAATTACHLQLSTDVEAKDTWTRSYPISANGSLTINNSNGRITVEAADVQAIEVSAERIVKAGTDAAANEQLKAFEIKEESGPDRVVIDSATRGIQINVSRRVNYTVRVPRGLAVTLDSSNGDISVTGVTGAFTASSSNGRIRGFDLAGSAKVSTSNGVIELTMAAVAEGGVNAQTSNGTVTVTVPRNTNADLTARVSNGAISRDNIDVQISEESRRRLDGRIGTGGPTIHLETTNGTVRLIGK